MVTYYHTASYIYAVVNDRCSKLMDAQGRPDENAPIIGCELVAGVRGMPGTEVPIREIAEGMYLRFKVGSNTITTQPVEKIERSVSLSIPPKPMAS